MVITSALTPLLLLFLVIIPTSADTAKDRDKRDQKLSNIHHSWRWILWVTTKPKQVLLHRAQKYKVVLMFALEGVPTLLPAITTNNTLAWWNSFLSLACTLVGPNILSTNQEETPWVTVSSFHQLLGLFWMGNEHEEECCFPPAPTNKFKELIVKLEAATHIIALVLLFLADTARIQAFVSKMLLSQCTDAYLHFVSCLPVPLATVLLRSALSNHTLWGTAVLRNL